MRLIRKHYCSRVFEKQEVCFPLFNLWRSMSPNYMKNHKVQHFWLKKGDKARFKSYFSWYNQYSFPKKFVTNLNTLMPCPFKVPKWFVLVQIFWTSPKIYLHIVPVTNILCQTKRCFPLSKNGFCAGTKVFEEALNAVKF